MSYFLRSERLGWRVWRDEDLPLACGLYGDAEVTRYIGGPEGEAQVRERLQREMGNQRELGFQYWPMFSLADGSHAGCAGLRPYGDDPAVVEVGVHIARPFWSGRYGEEAARAVIAHAFATYPVRALVARHHPENANSRALVARLGFVYSHDEFWGPNAVDCPTYVLRQPITR